MCPACMVKGNDRFFSQVGPGFEPLNLNEHCHSLVNENYVDNGGLHDEGSDDEESDDETDDEKHALDRKFKVLRKVEEQHNLLLDCPGRGFVVNHSVSGLSPIPSHWLRLR